MCDDGFWAGWGVGSIITDLPVPFQPYSSWLACYHAVSTSDTEAPVHNFDFFLPVFLNNPVYPRTFRAYPDALPASSTFFSINDYINHDCIYIMLKLNKSACLGIALAHCFG